MRSSVDDDKCFNLRLFFKKRFFKEKFKKIGNIILNSLKRYIFNLPIHIQEIDLSQRVNHQKFLLQQKLSKMYTHNDTQISVTTNCVFPLVPANNPKNFVFIQENVTLQLCLFKCGNMVCFGLSITVCFQNSYLGRLSPS